MVRLIMELKRQSIEKLCTDDILDLLNCTNRIDNIALRIIRGRLCKDKLRTNKELRAPGHYIERTKIRKPYGWSAASDQILRDNFHKQPLRFLAKTLHKSIPTVKARARRLHLTRKWKANPLATTTKTEV